MSPQNPRASQAPEWWRWAVPLGIALITAAAFLPVLRAEFVAFDDPENFLQNQRYRGLGWTHLRWMWTTTHLGHYVPLSWMTLGLDYLLWGMNPAGYHAVNLLLHVVNAVMVYFIARRLFTRADGRDARDDRATVIASAFAALMFAIHPLRVESVAWITERRDMVALLFSLGSVLCFLRYVDTSASRTRWYGVSLVLFVCALLSKATSVTLPAVLLILNVYPLRRVGGAVGWWGAAARRVYLETLPFGMASAVAAIGSILALQPGAQLPLVDKLAVSTYGFAFYLWKSVAPVGLAPLYERPAVLPTLSAPFVASYVITAAVVVTAWLVRRRWPAVTAALAAFSISIFPLLGIVQNGPQIVADRYTYHAAPALALLFGAAFTLTRREARNTIAIGAAILVGFGFLTFRQTAVWQDSGTLWRRVLQLDPGSYLANNNLGVVLANQGRSDEAIEHYRQSIRRRPSYMYAHNNLGYELAERGDIEGAIASYRAALAIDAGYVDAEVNWGNALLSQRRIDEAISHYATAARLDPNHAGVHFNWGVALREKGDVAGAVDHYRRALALDPALSDARRELDDALLTVDRQSATTVPR